MPKRPFLVLSNRECVPLEGPYRVEHHEGRWLVLGHNEVHDCRDALEAEAKMARLQDDEEAHRLANEALAGLTTDFDLADIRP